MKVEINIMPWYLPLLVELPIQPMFGTCIELSQKDLDRYISIIKSQDYSDFTDMKEEIDNAPASLADDDNEYWDDLFFNNEVKEINIVWNEEANDYVAQAILGRPYDLDDDFDDDDEEEPEEI